MIITPKQITNRRKQLNLSQKQLSELTGIPQGNISRIEKGLYNPTEETLSKIIGVLDEKVFLNKKQETINYGQKGREYLAISLKQKDPNATEEHIEKIALAMERVCKNWYDNNIIKQ